MTLKNIISLNIFLFSAFVLNSMEHPRDSHEIYKKNKKNYDLISTDRGKKEKKSENNKSLKRQKGEEQSQLVAIQNDLGVTSKSYHFLEFPYELIGLIFAANIDEILQSSDIYNFYSNIHKYTYNLRRISRIFDYIIKNIPIGDYRNLEHFAQNRIIEYFAPREKQMNEGELKEEFAKLIDLSNGYSDLSEDQKRRILRMIIVNPQIAQSSNQIFKFFCKNLAIIKMLLSFGVGYHSQDKKFNLKNKERKKLFTLLSNHAFNSDIDNKNISTLLYEGVWSCENFDIIKSFLALGANVDYRADLDKSTPLMLAACNDNSEIIKLLLSFGADIEARDECGLTPLMHAADCGSMNALETLLEHKADIYATDDYGKTLLYYSLAQNEGGHYDSEMLKRFLSYGLDLISRERKNYYWVSVVLAEAEIEDLRLLVEAGINLNIESSDGSTTFFVMIEQGTSAEAIELLLKTGADVNAHDNDGNFALLLKITELQNESDDEVKENCSKIVKLLLNYGANVNISDDNGNTPLMIAAKNGWTEIAELILKGQSDVDVKNIHGETALNIANRVGHNEIASLICKYLA